MRAKGAGKQSPPPGVPTAPREPPSLTSVTPSEPTSAAPAMSVAAAKNSAQTWQGRR